MIDFTHKTALFMGGITDLAVYIAAVFHQVGAKILFIHAADQTTNLHSYLKQVGLQDAVQLHSVDTNDPSALTGQVAACGRVDIAIINPGWQELKHFMDTTPAEWNSALAHNFEAATYAAQAAARHMIAQGNGGRIIFLSSVSSIMPFTETGALGASLSALTAMAKMAAVDLGLHGITVNMVAAGWVETDWARPYLHPEGRAYIEQGIPLGRVATMHDIANVCCFLASDLAAYITGAVIPVDGGYLLTRADGTTPYPERRQTP